MAPVETGDEAGHKGQRIPGVDILRGLALFGVLEVNLLTDFRVPLLSYLEKFHTHAGAANEAVDWVVGLALESKFLALFSLLFGAGLALQIEARGGQPRGAVAGFVLRRCAVLLALGLVHHTLVWNGDILALYGALGLALAPLLLGPRWLVLPGAAALALVSMIFQPDWLPHGARAQAEIDEALRVYAGGDLGEILGYRLHESRVLIVPLLVSVSPRVASLLLLGAWASRRGLLRGSEGSGRLLGGVALVALPLGAVSTALQAHAATFRWSLGAFGGPVGYLATAGMGVGYGAALLLALRSARLRAWLSPVASLGRLSLSMYLLQSLVFVLVFQKMGQIGRHGPAPVALFGVAVYALQVALAVVWLRRFRQGPFEALWRRLGARTARESLG